MFLVVALGSTRYLELINITLSQWRTLQQCFFLSHPPYPVCYFVIHFASMYVVNSIIQCYFYLNGYFKKALKTGENICSISFIFTILVTLFLQLVPHFHLIMFFLCLRISFNSYVF